MATDVSTPLRVLAYRVTLEDAVAYEGLSREFTGREKLWLILTVVPVGLSAGLLPDQWTRLERWGTVAMLAVVWLMAVSAVLHALRLRRARKRVAGCGAVELEEWGDRLVERSAAGIRQISVGMIGNVVDSDRQIFVLLDGPPVIIPLAAFQNEADMKAFSTVLDDKSRNAAL